MATTRSGDAPATEAPKPNGPKVEPAKLAEDFKPNEPAAKSGLDDKGQPDDTLSEKQLVRAGTEALLSLRPQPSREEVEKSLEALAERDEKGQPKNKVKTAKEGGDKAVEALNKLRGG